MVLDRLRDKINKQRFKAERDRLVTYFFDRGGVFVGLTIGYSWSFLKAKSDPQKNVDFVKGCVVSYLQYNLPKFDLIEFASLVVEFYENEEVTYPRLHVLLCFRSLIDFEGKILEKIKEEFDEEEIEAEYFKNYEDIIKFWDFATETVSTRADLRRFYLLGYRCLLNNTYSYIWEYLDMDGEWNANNTGCLSNHKDAKIEGLNFKKVSNPELVVLNFLGLFMVENKMFMAAGRVYQKDFDSFVTYRCLGTLDIFLTMMDEIIGYLATRFVFQLERVDLKFLFIEHLPSTIASFNRALLALPSSKILDGVVEFKDGLYLMGLDVFIRLRSRLYKELTRGFDYKVGCTKNFKVKFQKLNENPLTCLVYLRKCLNNSEEAVSLFCSRLACLFYGQAGGLVFNGEILVLNENLGALFEDERLFDIRVTKLLEDSLTKEGLSPLFVCSSLDKEMFLDTMKEELPQFLIYANRLLVNKYLKKKYRGLKNSRCGLNKVKCFLTATEDFLF